MAINAIGPVWDGNEVWLIVGGAAIFAAFPGWYATWFSAGYLAMVLLLRRADRPRGLVRVPWAAATATAGGHLVVEPDDRQHPRAAADRRGAR